MTLASFLAGLAVFAVLSSAQACSCASDAFIFNQDRAYSAAQGVFIGKVVAIETMAKGAQPIKRISFQVLKGWKGTTGIRAQIETESHMCGLHPEKGPAYLVYDHGDSSKNNACSGTGLAGSDLAREAIRKFGKPNSLK
jgi:hypothetical protein